MTNDGYIARFWELVAEYRENRAPMRDALISLESELLVSSGVQRYSTYRSFSAAKSRKPQGAKFRQPKTV